LKAEWEKVSAMHLLEDNKIGSKTVEEKLANRFVGDANENALYSMSSWEKKKKQELGNGVQTEVIDPYLAM
jgi:hypothetical protein